MWKAKRRFDVRVDGVMYRVKKSDRLADGHPAVAARPRLFDRVDEPAAAPPVSAVPDPEPEPAADPGEPVQSRPSGGQVRAWARDNGYDVPSRGPVPGHVVDAYRHAKEGGE